MTDKRLLLRVMAKLMVLAGVLFVVYVFFAGWVETDSPLRTLDIDVSAIEPGEAGYFTLGQRRLVVVNRGADGRDGAEGYFVAYGRDTVYGCELRLEGSPGRLKSQCADVEYRLDGRLIRGTPYHEDLKSPAYQWLDHGHLRVTLQ